MHVTLGWRKFPEFLGSLLRPGYQAMTQPRPLQHSGCGRPVGQGAGVPTAIPGVTRGRQELRGQSRSPGSDEDTAQFGPAQGFCLQVGVQFHYPRHP